MVGPRFLRGSADSQEVAPTYYFATFLPKTACKLKNLDGEGALVSAALLDPRVVRATVLGVAGGMNVM